MLKRQYKESKSLTKGNLTDLILFIKLIITRNNN